MKEKIKKAIEVVRLFNKLLKEFDETLIRLIGIIGLIILIVNQLQ